MYRMRPISNNRKQITDEDGRIVAVVRDDLAEPVFEFLGLMEAGLDTGHRDR